MALRLNALYNGPTRRQTNEIRAIDFENNKEKQGETFCDALNEEEDRNTGLVAAPYINTWQILKIHVHMRSKFTLGRIMNPSESECSLAETTHIPLRKVLNYRFKMLQSLCAVFRVKPRVLTSEFKSFT